MGVIGSLNLLWLSWECFPCGCRGPPDLEGIPGHSDDHGEGGTSRERRVVAPLFRAPAAMLEAVNNHISWEAVIARVEMQCHVCVMNGTTLQVHMEPKKKRKIQEMNISSICRISGQNVTFCLYSRTWIGLFVQLSDCTMLFIHDFFFFLYE